MQQPSDAARTALTLTPLHRRRDAAQRITAVALHPRAGRVYLGLDSGVLEEHRLVAAAAGGSIGGGGGGSIGGSSGGSFAPASAALRLQAERHLFRGAVASLAIAFAAARVAALSDDGAVLLVTLESFHLAPLPAAARGATAIAADPDPARFPARLAVACRAPRGRSRVGVYDVVPGSASAASGHGALLRGAAAVEAPAVLDVAWVGGSLALAIPGGYAIARPPPPSAAGGDGGGGAGAGGATAAADWQVTLLADHLTAPPVLAPVPGARRVVLAWDEGLLLVAGEDGAARQAPLALPLPPLALAAAGAFVVAVCDDGVHVFDRCAWAGKRVELPACCSPFPPRRYNTNHR